MEWSVNYFGMKHFGGRVFFLKNGCVECNFIINSGCQSKLPKIIIVLISQMNVDVLIFMEGVKKALP